MVEAFNAANPQNPKTEEEFQAENDKVTGRFDHLIRLADDSKDVLKALRNSGKRMGIVTTRGAQSFNRLLESHGIKEYFEVVITKSESMPEDELKARLKDFTTKAKLKKNQVFSISAVANVGFLYEADSIKAIEKNPVSHSIVILGLIDAKCVIKVFRTPLV